MNKETLHTLRLIIPGTFLLIILILLLRSETDLWEFKIDTDSILYFIIVFGFGVLYYAFNPRMHIMKTSLKEIMENIKDKLLAPFSKDEKIAHSTDYLREGDRLLNVFYHFIDTDNSLIERAKEVYFNGLIWSSLADLIIIGPFGVILHIVGFLITKNFTLVIIACILLILSITSFLLIPIVVKKHINLSNNQLTCIVDLHKKDLRDQIIALL